MIIQHDIPLSEVLWYKIGGRAKYLITCENRKDISEAFAFIKKEKLRRIFICGLGSNLIFSDDDFDGAVIRIVSKPNRHSGLSRISQGENSVDDSDAGHGQNDVDIINGNQVTAFAGVIFGDVITFALDKGLIGLEWGGGLPGTLGAAVRGNVGAYGGEVKDSLVSAEVIDYSGDTPVLKTLTNEDLQFVYRGSLVKTHKKMIVVSATFGLQKGTSEEVAAAKEVCERNKQNRRDKHPLEYPNCGSVFKNLREKEQVEKVLSVYPDLKENIEKRWYGKVAVASLIERLGLKGFRVGNAQVSEKHALFIINLGNAKAADVLEIIKTIKNKFHETFGFEPEVEVEIVSET